MGAVALALIEGHSQPRGPGGALLSCPPASYQGPPLGRGSWGGSLQAQGRAGGSGWGRGEGGGAHRECPSPQREGDPTPS